MLRSEPRLGHLGHFKRNGTLLRVSSRQYRPNNPYTPSNGGFGSNCPKCRFRLEVPA
jgi:hypothetical protein